MFYTETYCPGVADFDRDGKLAYEAILRILENTASRHSDSSGDDVIDGSRRGITWVLTDWRVEIVRRPQSKAPLQVATWVRDNAPVGRVFRDYTITDTSGTELVRAESRLILFDLRTEKIVRIDRERFASYRPEARSVFPDTAPRLPMSLTRRRCCRCDAATSILTVMCTTRDISSSRLRRCRKPCAATRFVAFASSIRRRSRTRRPSRSSIPPQTTARLCVCTVRTRCARSSALRPEQKFPGANRSGESFYCLHGFAGSGSVGSQPRFGLVMSSHGADGFGTGRDEAL